MKPLLPLAQRPFAPLYRRQRVRLSVLRPRAGQRGMVLILTMLFAVASMILALGAVNSVVQSERAAGDLRIQNISFRAAEAALVAANAHLQLKLGSLITGDPTSCTNGCTGLGDYPTSTPLTAKVSGDPGQPSYWSGFNWKTGNYATKITVQIGGTNSTAVNLDAYYIIEQLNPPAGSTVNSAYRITVMSYGDGNQGSMTILQATYTT
jgi:Tfp pilus assembly protein PilX